MEKGPETLLTGSWKALLEEHSQEKILPVHFAQHDLSTMYSMRNQLLKEKNTQRGLDFQSQRKPDPRCPFTICWDWPSPGILRQIPIRPRREQPGAGDSTEHKSPREQPAPECSQGPLVHSSGHSGGQTRRSGMKPASSAAAGPHSTSPQVQPNS